MAQIDMLGITVRDMAASLRFYRLLGLDTPANVEGEPYIEVITPNGYRISWNSLEMIKSLDPDWVEPVGHRMALALQVRQSRRGGRALRTHCREWIQGSQAAVGCVLGPALRTGC